CEYPQKYGKPGKRRVAEDQFGRSVESLVEVPNVLVHDLQRWANQVLDTARANTGHLFPFGKDRREPLAYLWARTVPCSNPSCKQEIPLIRSLLLRSKSEKVALKMSVDRKREGVRFSIVRGSAIQATVGTKAQRGPAKCPYCSQPTSEDDIRHAAIDHQM